jgi:hypothetical protein
MFQGTTPYGRSASGEDAHSLPFSFSPGAPAGSVCSVISLALQAPLWYSL